jgi:hypothetical protein
MCFGKNEVSSKVEFGLAMAGRLQLGMVPVMVRSAVLLLFVALTAASLQSFPSPLAPHSGRACPALSGKGCSACVAAPTDGRCPGHWCDQPCVHTSQGVGKGRKGDCFPANWWATQKHTYPKVTCTGNGTGCRRVCGTPAPAPPAPPPCPHPGPVPPPADVATATYLTDYPNAVCLDGSPGYYVCAHCTPRPSMLSRSIACHARVGVVTVHTTSVLSELHLTVHQFGLAVVPPPRASWCQCNKMGLSYPRGRLVR